MRLKKFVLAAIFAALILAFMPFPGDDAPWLDGTPWHQQTFEAPTPTQTATTVWISDPVTATPQAYPMPPQQKPTSTRQTAYPAPLPTQTPWWMHEEPTWTPVPGETPRPTPTPP